MAVEERVTIAIDNWAPRFIANGVDSNDLQSLTRSIQHWEDWSPTWSALAANARAWARPPKPNGTTHRRASTSCARRCSIILASLWWCGFPAQLRAGHENTVRVYQRGMPYFEPRQ